MRSEPNPEWEEEGWSDSILTIEQNGEWSSAHWIHAPIMPDFTIGSAGLFYADVMAITFSIGLMVALIRHPEWYVVNVVGILVGAGVITILGVSFDEWLILLFMVLAAAYDAWAVYRSKHMLELADTMIGLKLPILLVAPQNKNYSFITEGEQVMSEPAAAPTSPAEGDATDDASKASEAWQAAATASPPPPKPTKSGGEAMFMGLGDVIFPGMLAISALTWLPKYAGPLGMSAPLWVAIFTTIGGLCGYLILMTYVARGKPQAGLPLLNGGSILGYLISASILIGYKAFEFNITLF
jgi:presenilin-like A22 family membrane protease